jgi:hypothetical protein
MRASGMRSMQGPQAVAAVCRPDVPIAVNSEKGDRHLNFSSNHEAAADGLAYDDSDEARYWRRPKVTPPNVRRAAIIKKRSAKLPWTGPTRSDS